MESIDFAKITKCEIKEGQLNISTSENNFSFEIKNISERLAKATETQLAKFISSPSGYGIHWIDLDEDISLQGLLNTSNKV